MVPETAIEPASSPVAKLAIPRLRYSLLRNWRQAVIPASSRPDRLDVTGQLRELHIVDDLFPVHARRSKRRPPIRT
jgi:hypothetical protein